MLNGVLQYQSLDKHFFGLANSMSSFYCLGLKAWSIDWIDDKNDAGSVEIQTKCTAGNVNEQDSNRIILIEEFDILGASRVV